MKCLLWQLLVGIVLFLTVPSVKGLDRGEIEYPNDSDVILNINKALNTSSLSGPELQVCLNVSIDEIMQILTKDQKQSDPNLIAKIPLHELVNSYIRNKPESIYQIEKCLGIPHTTDNYDIDDALFKELYTKMSSSTMTSDDLLECIKKSIPILHKESPLRSLQLNKLFQDHSETADKFVKDIVIGTIYKPILSNETIKCLDNSPSIPLNEDSTEAGSTQLNTFSTSTEAGSTQSITFSTSTEAGSTISTTRAASDTNSDPVKPQHSNLGLGLLIFLVIVVIVAGIAGLFIFMHYKKRRQLDLVEMTTK